MTAIRDKQATSIPPELEEFVAALATLLLKDYQRQRNREDQSPAEQIEPTGGGEP